MALRIFTHLDWRQVQPKDPQLLDDPTQRPRWHKRAAMTAQTALQPQQII
jgi:hypothetical protein